MKNVCGFTLIDYIKSSIEILMNMKMDESGNQKHNGRYSDINDPELEVGLPSALNDLKDATSKEIELNT